MPVSIGAKLLQRHLQRDESLAWKFELVRRRDQLAKLEMEAQASCCRDAYACVLGVELASQCLVGTAAVKAQEAVMVQCSALSRH